MNSINITWELARNADSQPYPSKPTQTLEVGPAVYFNKPPGDAGQHFGNRWFLQIQVVAQSEKC